MEYIRQTHVNTHEFLMYVRFDYNSTQSLINQKVYLTDAQRLHNVRVVGMQVLSFENFSKALVLPFVDITYFAITLIGKHGELLIEKYPLADLHKNSTQGNIRRFDCLIDPTQSYVERFGVPGSETANDTIPILFSYRLK